MMKIEAILDIYRYSTTDGKQGYTIYQSSAPKKLGHVLKRYRLIIDIPDEDLGIDGKIAVEIQDN